MKPTRFSTSLLALTTLLVLAGPAAAGEQPLPLQFEGQTSVAWVLVPVIVTNENGDYVKGLEASDFELQVDDRKIAFESFDREIDSPMSLVFLQDLSGSMANGGKLEASREALGYFLEQARKGDELALATFASESFQVEVPFTQDLSVLQEARAEWKAYGTTALHDAVAWLPDIHAGSRHFKRAAVLLTDGVDNASTLTPEAAREIVHQARLPVFVLGFTSSHRDSPPENSTLSYAQLLRQLATASGGRYYEVNDPDDLKEACIAIADELRHQYVLGFRTSGEGANEEHRLRVLVRSKQRLTVAHRAAYRGAPPP